MIQTRKMPLFLIVLLVMLAGCNRNAELCLTMADECLETDPNRAFKYLSELEDVDNLSDELQARYALLYTQATYNCNIPFANDSLINIAVDYYTRHGKRHDAAKALLYKGVLHTQYKNYWCPLKLFVAKEMSFNR